MNDENNIMKVFSGETRSEVQQLRDEIEILKCQLENLERENTQLKEDISDAIELGTVCFLCAEKDECSGPAPRNIDTDEGHNYGDVCPEDANPLWIGMPENADEQTTD